MASINIKLIMVSILQRLYDHCINRFVKIWIETVNSLIKVHSSR